MQSVPPPTSAPDELPPPGSDEPPWRLWTAPAAVVLGLALGIVATLVVEIIGSSAGSSLSHPTPAVSIIGDIVFDLSFVAAAIYFVAIQGRPRPADFGFRRIGLKLGATAFAVAAGGYYLVTLLYASVVKLHGSDKLPSELGVSKSTAALVAATVFVCVIAPIAEEFFFRGFFFGVLRQWRINVAGRELGPWVAAVLTGILFGLAHTGSASSQYLLPLGFLGFVLCLVRWRTGSLYPCMALHSANNALALGVNQEHWSAPAIAGLMVGSLLVIATATGPLSARRMQPDVQRART
jgi:membrane protease YdiL (CAAX protease family)